MDLRVREVPLQLTGPVPSPVEGGSLLDKVPEAPAPGAPQAPARRPWSGPRLRPAADPDAEIVTTGSAEPERVAPPPPVQGPEPEKKPPQH